MGGLLACMQVHHLSGRIEGCCTDVESVDATNERHFLPILHDLSKRTFFRYFKVDLWRPCPFWEEDGQCHMRDCAVCECDANEIPACWREQDGGYGAGAGAGGRTGSDDDEEADNDDENDEEHGEEEEDEEVVAVLSRVDVVTPPVMAGGGWALANGVQTKAPAPPAAAAAAAASPGSSAAASSEGTGEVEGAAVWTEEEEGPHVQYVNLLNNPEGYTAWAGPSAMRVWRAIYEENCFSRSTATTTTGKGMGKGGKAHGRDYGDGKHTPAAATATAATGGAAMAAPTAAGGAAHATDDDDDGVCGEERVFYRILSGLQTSINTHIAMTYNGGRGMARGTDVYTSGPATGKGVTAGGGAAGDGASGNPLQRAAAGVRAAVDTWLPAVGLWGLRAWGVLTGVPEKHAARLTRLHASAAAAAAGASPAGDGDDAHAGSHELVLSRGVTPSLDMYIQRIGQHPDRLNNLYFTFLFMLRAVDKAAPLLQALNYSTGNATEDAATAALVSRLLTVEAPAVLRGFDEKALPLMAGLDSWHKSTTAAAAAAVGAPAGSKGAPGAAGGGVQSSQADASTSAAAAAGGALGVDAVRGAELSDLIDRYKATGAAASSSGASSGASVLPKGAGALLPQATGGSGDFDPALAMRESWREKYRNISRIMGESRHLGGGPASTARRDCACLLDRVAHSLLPAVHPYARVCRLHRLREVPPVGQAAVPGPRHRDEDPLCTTHHPATTGGRGGGRCSSNGWRWHVAVIVIGSVDGLR